MNRRVRLATPAIIAIVLAGCVKAPAVRNPDLDVTVPRQYDAADESAAEVRSTWWEDFGDPAMSAAIVDALDHNHDLRAAAARVDRAAAEARIAGADLQPTLGVSVNAGRGKNVFVLPDFGQGGGGVTVQSLTNSNFGVSLDVAWEADLWGRLAASARAAVADLQAADSDYHGARLSLAGQTAKAWLALGEIGQQESLAARTVTSWQRSYERVLSRYTRGVGASLDVRLAKANLDAAKALLDLRRSQLDRSVRQFETLLGKYPGRDLEGPQDLPGMPRSIPGGLPADLVSRRPDLVVAERRLAAADQRLLSAKRSLYPRLTLTGSSGSSTVELADLLDGDFGVWSLVAGLTQPIFQGGRLRAGVDRAEAGSVEAIENYASAVLRAYAEVESTLAAEDYLSNREGHLAEASKQSTAAQELAEDRYAAGLGLFITVLESQRRALDAESALLTVRRERLENRVDLYLALGGGFDRPVDQDLSDLPSGDLRASVASETVETKP